MAQELRVASVSCPASEILEAIAAGQAAPTATGDHLATCETCRRTLERMREDNRFLSSFAIHGALPSAPPAETARDIEIAGYKIVREIHRGGQGVVFQAVQHSTKRDVAIKVMRQGPFATLADRNRFEREIETLGRLEHRNIVAVHDAGVAAGFHYFVMNYVDGQPLDEWMSDGGWRMADVKNGGLSPDPSKLQNPKSKIAAVLDLFIKICDAVHAAHLRGVIHRDLKPSNICVDRSGEPHVLDFGLAKSLDAQRDSAMTRTGQFVGSLPWAAPEQLEGEPDKVDLRTDVYSLGAILFQLLTGALPFDVGSNLRAAFDNILSREPPRPSALAAAARGARIDDELDTIVLKCLSKDRERRYQSAGELARDLRRYLACEPIEAKRDSALYVLRKTLRRYRVRVGAAAAFVVLLGVFGVVMALLYRHSARLEQDAVQSAGSLSDLLLESNIEQGRMAGMLGNLEQAEQLLWRELLIHRQAGEKFIAHLNDPPGPPVAYWGLWELYRKHPCLRTLTPQPLAVRGATVADDGASLWTADPSGLVQKIDAFGARLDSYRITFPGALGLPYVDARGRIVINQIGADFAAWRRDAGDRPLIEFPPLTNSEAEVFCVSRSARLLATLTGDEALVWNTESGRQIARFRSSDADLTAIAISNDDRRLAARDRSGGLHVWDLESQRLVVHVRATAALRENAHSLGDLLFSPDDRWLADAWTEIAGRIWDLSADPPTPIELSERPRDYRVQSFSPDGSLLAIGDLGGVLRTFDVRTGQRRSATVAHPGRVRSSGFTGDGAGVWTSGEGDLRLWEVASDAGVRRLRIEDEVFHGVDISADGRWLAAGGGLGKLYRIERTSFQAVTHVFGNDATLSSIAISPDSSRVAAASYANAVHVWPAENLDQSPLGLLHPHRVSHVCFSPDGERLATACDDTIVRLWRVADGALERELRGCNDRVPQIAFDPAGRRLAAAVRNGALLVWDLQSGQCVTLSAASQSPLRAVQFSHDGRWLAAAGADRAIQIWDAALGQRSATLVGHNQEVYCLDLSPNGELIASGDSGGVIRLWHLGLRRPLATLDGHAGAVMAVRFSPDGQALVSASLDGTIREWDLAYYARHIAGQVEAQLRKLGPDQTDESRAAAWREWATRVLRGNQAPARIPPPGTPR